MKKMFSKYCLKNIAYCLIPEVGGVCLSFARDIHLLAFPNALTQPYDSAVEGVKKTNVSG